MYIGIDSGYHAMACLRWWVRAQEWSTGEWSNQWLMGGAALQVQSKLWYIGKWIIILHNGILCY